MIEIEEVRLNYRVSGDGDPVVFLHGFLESSSMWENLSFPKEIQCICIDLPGHGESVQFSKEDFSIVDIAEMIKKLLNEVGITNYALVGHSLGGYVGVELMKIDGNCQKMVFLNSNFWSDNAQKIIDRQRVAKIVLRNKTSFIYEAIPHLFLDPTKYKDAVVGLIKEAKNISAQTISNYSIAMSKRKDNSDFVRNNAKKVLVIQGEEDSVVSCEKMNKYFLQFGFNYKVLSPCGHMSHFEKKQEVEKKIFDFLLLNYSY